MGSCFNTIIWTHVNKFLKKFDLKTSIAKQQSQRVNSVMHMHMMHILFCPNKSILCVFMSMCMYDTGEIYITPTI